MLRFPPPLPGREPVVVGPGASPETLSPLALGPPAAPRRGDNGPAPTANKAGGGPRAGEVTAADEVVLGGSGWVGDTEDSLESGPLRREAISTMGVVSPEVAYKGGRYMGAQTCALVAELSLSTAGEARCRSGVETLGPVRFVLRTQDRGWVSLSSQDGVGEVHQMISTRRRHVVARYRSVSGMEGCFCCCTS